MTPEYEIRDDTFYVPEHPHKGQEAGDGKITIIQGGEEKGWFTVNQDTDTTIELDSGAALSKDYKNESGKTIGSIKVGQIVPKGTSFEQFVELAFKPGDDIIALGITLNKHTVDLTIGETETLIATVTPLNATGQVIWTSSDTSIATVVNGVVTAISDGTVTIRATIDSVTDVCSFVVSHVVVVKDKLYFSGPGAAIIENDDSAMSVIEAVRSELTGTELQFDIAMFDPSEGDLGISRFYAPKSWLPYTIQVYSGGKWQGITPSMFNEADIQIDGIDYTSYKTKSVASGTKKMKLIF
jgi:hypothetical protein